MPVLEIIVQKLDITPDVAGNCFLSVQVFQLGYV
jgi:hypothetical protein